MFSYSHFETFALFLGALTVGYCAYEEVVKRLAKEPEKPAAKTPIRHQNKRYDPVAQPVAKKPLCQRFELEIKGSNKVKELTSENFKELLSHYFIAVDYLQELWLQHKFNLIITNDLKKYYGKDKALNGFIRYRQIPEIYIKASTSSKHRTGVLIHEIAHLKAQQDARLKNVSICSHGPEFKRHMKLLFQPLLVDKTYYRKHHELSYHLSNEANRFTPTRDMCV
jgi:hypothetical protein